MTEETKRNINVTVSVGPFDNVEECAEAKKVMIEAAQKHGYAVRLAFFTNMYGFPATDPDSDN